MFFRLKINGKSSPIAVGGDKIRLSIITDGIDVKGEILYEIFASVEDKDTGKVYKKTTTTSRYAYFNSEFFEDGKEYFAKASIDLDGDMISTPVCSFRMGIRQENFNAKWIDSPAFDGRVLEFNKNW